MITKEKFVKIIDFGMAKKVDSAYSRQEDCNTTVVGTLPYMVKGILFWNLMVLRDIILEI